MSKFPVRTEGRSVERVADRAIEISERVRESGGRLTSPFPTASAAKFPMETIPPEFEIGTLEDPNLSISLFAEKSPLTSTSQNLSSTLAYLLPTSAISALAVFAADGEFNVMKLIACIISLFAPPMLFAQDPSGDESTLAQDMELLSQLFPDPNSQKHFTETTGSSFEELKVFLQAGNGKELNRILRGYFNSLGAPFQSIAEVADTNPAELRETVISSAEEAGPNVQYLSRTLAIMEANPHISTPAIKALAEKLRYGLLRYQTETVSKIFEHEDPNFVRRITGLLPDEIVELAVTNPFLLADLLYRYHETIADPVLTAAANIPKDKNIMEIVGAKDIARLTVLHRTMQDNPWLLKADQEGNPLVANYRNSKEIISQYATQLQENLTELYSEHRVKVNNLLGLFLSNDLDGFFRRLHQDFADVIEVFYKFSMEADGKIGYDLQVTVEKYGLDETIYDYTTEITTLALANLWIMEGLAKTDPDIQNKFIKIMDGLKIYETYKSEQETQTQPQKEEEPDNLPAFIALDGKNPLFPEPPADEEVERPKQTEDNAPTIVDLIWNLFSKLKMN